MSQMEQHIIHGKLRDIQYHMCYLFNIHVRVHTKPVQQDILLLPQPRHCCYTVSFCAALPWMLLHSRVVCCMLAHVTSGSWALHTSAVSALMLAIICTKQPHPGNLAAAVLLHCTFPFAEPKLSRHWRCCICHPHAMGSSVSHVHVHVGPKSEEVEGCG